MNFSDPEVIEQIVAWAIANPAAAQAVVSGRADVVRNDMWAHDEGAILYEALLPEPLPMPADEWCNDIGFNQLNDVDGWRMTHLYNEDIPERVWVINKLEKDKRIKIQQQSYLKSSISSPNFQAPSVRWDVQTKARGQWKTDVGGEAPDVVSAIKEIATLFDQQRDHSAAGELKH